jgi:hypothetical protein
MKRRSREAGTVLPLIAASLSILMGFGGIAVDVGFLEYRQQAQQVATDAAAAGGAESLLHAGCPNQAAAQSAGYGDASSNGFTHNTNGVAITITNPPANGPFANNPCAVYVTVTTSHVATFFTRLFGYSGGATETTQAAAIVTQTGGGCIYLLSPNVITNFNGGNVTAKQCGALINDTANFNGSKVDVASIGYAGPAPNENGATFTAGVPAPMLPVADPCPEIPGCAYLTANPPSTSSCNNIYDGSGQLWPGCYSGNLNLNKATVTMNPGLYIFNGTENFDQASITGNGVTMYVTANGSPPNFNKTLQVSMTPQTSGPEQGVLYYQVPANAQSPNFNGTNVNYSGLIYAPTPTSVNFNGANGGYLVLVFGAVNFNGSVPQDFATPPPEQSLVKQAVVAE